jgi:hypothetical protein
MELAKIESLPLPTMEPRPLRIAYALEFLLALIACFECWSQIGGQAPLDLMPWWLKFLLASALASAFVRLTAVAVHNRLPSVPVVRWSIAFVLVLVVVAITTYYFYLHLPPDEENTDEPIPTTYVLK